MLARLRETTALPSLMAQSCRASLCRYIRDEDGALAAPTVMFFLAMMTVGGIGIDLMRMERDRTKLQNTLDRAVLAAADLDQPLSPPEVVLDYLTKAGLASYYQTPDHDTGLGYRWVEGTIDADFDAQYLGLSGGGDLPLHVSSRAEERIESLEISLVLDVSGSMRSNNRLSNLKIAAKNFIDTMVVSTTDGKMSMSIIPYATQVSAPEELFDQYNVTAEHNYSRCINFQSSDFLTTSLSPTAELERTMHFSPWASYDYRTRSPQTLVDYPVCEEKESREMLLFQKDATTLKTFITNLTAWGNTSIDLGMKWGTTLLDPSTRPAINALATATSPTVPTEFSARPSEYNDSDTIKVIVLMTDGQNTSQYYVEDDHRRNDSNVWYTQHAGKNGRSLKTYSTLKTSTGNYYWHLPYGEEWANHALGTGTDSFRDCKNGYCDWIEENGTVERLSYAKLFAYTSLKYLYRYIYADWMGTYDARSEWYYGVYDYVGSTTKNNRTNSICDAAKAQGIVVYTIGFEAPSSGQAVLRSCASSPAHYFDVDGLEITDAFASIATSIRQLRLTQ